MGAVLQQASKLVKPNKFQCCSGVEELVEGELGAESLPLPPFASTSERNGSRPPSLPLLPPHPVRYHALPLPLFRCRKFVHPCTYLPALWLTLCLAPLSLPRPATNRFSRHSLAIHSSAPSPRLTRSLVSVMRLPRCVPLSHLLVSRYTSVVPERRNRRPRGHPPGGNQLWIRRDRLGDRVPLGHCRGVEEVYMPVVPCLLPFKNSKGAARQPDGAKGRSDRGVVWHGRHWRAAGAGPCSPLSSPLTVSAMVPTAPGAVDEHFARVGADHARRQSISPPREFTRRPELQHKPDRKRHTRIAR